MDSYSGQRRPSVAVTATLGSEVASAGGCYRSQQNPGTLITQATANFLGQKAKRPRPKGHNCNYFYIGK